MEMFALKVFGLNIYSTQILYCTYASMIGRDQSLISRIERQPDLLKIGSSQKMYTRENDLVYSN